MDLIDPVYKLIHHNHQYVAQSKLSHSKKNSWMHYV